jgi:hypothetical protein
MRVEDGREDLLKKGCFPMRYTPDVKRAMIVATMEKFDGPEFAWGDFLQRLQADYGEEGLSYGSIYGFMKKQRLADFSGTLCRKIAS